MFIRSRACFSLLELAVVTAFLLTLFTLTFPVVQKTIHHTQLVHCKGNLRLMFRAVSMYSEDENGSLPGSCTKWINPRYKVSGAKKSSKGHKNLDLFSNYVAPYYESKSIDRQYAYIPDLMCPSNSEREDEKLVYNRAQYHLPKAKDAKLGRPFGYYEEMNAYGEIPRIEPLTFFDIDDPQGVMAIKDVWLRHELVTTVHEDFKENQLFFDGATTTQEILPGEAERE